MSIEEYLGSNRMNIINLLDYLLQKGHKEIFPNMMTLLELAAHCPTLTAKVEHGLSLMNLLYTSLLSSMSHQSLEYLTPIYLTSELTGKKWDVVDTFIK